MTDVLVIDKDVVVEVQQPTIPPAAKPPNIGLVEVNQLVQRGSIWSTGHGAPVAAGGQAGDLYLDVDTGDIYQWNGASWDFQGTFAPATLTPAEILAALITVDGAGSDLDADLLDGQHGAYYATQADMTAVEDVNTTQDASIAANASAITFNANNIATLQTDMTAVEAGQTAAAILAKLITVDGPGSGLDADTLDGHDTSFFLPAGTYTAADILAKLLTVDGAGSGLDADLLDGHDSAFFLPAGTYTAADILAKLLTVDGAGSGLDADMIDGHDTAYLLALANATGTISDTQHGNRGGGSLHSLATSAAAGFMVDAPADSLVYGRKNNAWSTVIGGATTDDNPPAGPLQDGQMWWKSSTGVLYLYYDDGNSQQWVQAAASPQIVDAYYRRKTARAKNMLVNPSMQHSQENGNSAVGNNAYPADQWLLAFSGFAAQGIRSQSVVSPDGSPNTLMHSFSTTRPSPAAGDYCQLYQTIEGQDVADLEWGTASAKPAVLRFNAACETAGTYTVSVVSSNGDYTWCGSFTCDGTLSLKTFVFPIPAQTSGTFPKDNTAGLAIRFCYAAGSTYSTGVAGWQAGNKLAIAGQTNGATVINKNMVITDVGLYADPDNTGLPPPWETPDPITELLKCQRYWYQNPSFQIAGYNTAGSGVYATMGHKVTMRTAPTINYTTTTATNCSTADVRNATVDSVLPFAVAAATGALVFNGSYKLSARM
jgi:hypothetical protein